MSHKPFFTNLLRRCSGQSSFGCMDQNNLFSLQQFNQPGEEPSPGNDPWLESPRGCVGKDLAVENAQNNFDKPVVGNKPGSGSRLCLDKALGWNKPLAGKNPGLERAQYWKQPLGWKEPLAGNRCWAGKSLVLETAPGWKDSPCWEAVPGWQKHLDEGITP